MLRLHFRAMPMFARPRLCTAPLLDVSDRHARYFWRLLSRKALLYTEMVNMGAICRGGLEVAENHLRYNAEEHPVALQLGGSDPAMLAQSARMGEQWGYDEINLNCGCPSDRVQRGAFGACLMREPRLVADCVKAMRDAVQRVPVTVKHRIGVDREESYAFVRDFVGTVADAGCAHFIVHARNAWLQGLSPKENREIPPLRYDVAYQLKRDFPHLHITLNGGIATPAQIQQHWQHVDAVMVGREAWNNPWSLAQWDALMDGQGVDAPAATTRDAVEEAMVAYMEREWAAHGTSGIYMARAMLGLHNGLRGARKWRQVWSNHAYKTTAPRAVWQLARQHVLAGAEYEANHSETGDENMSGNTTAGAV